MPQLEQPTGLSPFICMAGVEHVMGAGCLWSSLQPGLMKGLHNNINDDDDYDDDDVVSKQRPTKEKQSTAVWGWGRSFAKPSPCSPRRLPTPVPHL